LVCDGFGEKGFACSWGTIEDDTLGWFYSHFFVEFWMGEREFDGFLMLEGTARRVYFDFLDLVFKTSNVGV